MIDDITLEKFKECTKGHDNLISRIKIFEYVRNIPYAIIPELIDPGKGPPGIIMRNKGSCSPKHFLLKFMFEKLNIPVKFASYPFSWNEFKVAYPDNLKHIIEELPLDYHLACMAHINGSWIMVDATWDPPLLKKGFPVNESWDGKSNTLNAVNANEEIIHDTAEQRITYVKSKEKNFSKTQRELYKSFISSFNKWLEEIRALN